MKKILALVLAALSFASCYKGTPACQPGTVDYPRCNDLTQPPHMGASLLYPGSGLPNTGSTVGRPGTPVLIASASVSAVATYTSPTWPAEKYQEIIIEVDANTSGFSYFRFQANADAGANYFDAGTNNSNNTASGDSNYTGTNGFARVGVAANLSAGDLHTSIHFYPLTTGRGRFGFARSLGVGTSISLSYGRETAFYWTNTATAVTFVTLSVSGVTMTGQIRVWGVPG